MLASSRTGSRSLRLPLLMLWAALTSGAMRAEPAGAADHPVAIEHAGLNFSFREMNGNLRLIDLLPSAVTPTAPAPAAKNAATGVEVALQMTGYNWPGHHATKFVGSQPGLDLRFEGIAQARTEQGGEDTIRQTTADGAVQVVSHYRWFEDVPVVQRWTTLINHGAKPVGIEHLSSATIHGFDARLGGGYPGDLVLHYAINTWQAEGQWREASLTELGLVDNGGFTLNAVSFGNVGSWSTMSYLPLAVLEDRRHGVAWFWQIEHDGAWHWEIGTTPDRVPYLYMGGPDALHSDAWKNLAPQTKYETVPVAIGSVKGGFDEAIAALTAYRRKIMEPQPDRPKCAVIFNDYMNCLWADPTPAKELPLIAAAAAAGCEYFVIDAGWYAEPGRTWWDTVGAWEPSKSRWGAAGLKGVMDAIHARGMIPGIWLEIEVAGINSPLKDKPDAWFMMRHGRRVIDNGRFFLDFRNPEVRDFAMGVVDRLVHDFGIGYIKFDYNVDALLGTDQGAESAGQGLLEHQRAYLEWIDEIHRRHAELVLENCGSGGGRMDYALLARHSLQSSSDQTDYRRYPAIVVGAAAAVLPEQLAVWAYPKKSDSVDAASFNLVSAMLTRIHLSGELASLPPASEQIVHEGIRVYKASIRPSLPRLVPFFPLGLPRIDRNDEPIALGMRGDGKTFVAVWRLQGPARVHVPIAQTGSVKVLYPASADAVVAMTAERVDVTLPRPYTAVLLEINASGRTK